MRFCRTPGDEKKWRVVSGWAPTDTVDLSADPTSEDVRASCPPGRDVDDRVTPPDTLRFIFRYGSLVKWLHALIRRGQICQQGFERNTFQDGLAIVAAVCCNVKKTPSFEAKREIMQEIRTENAPLVVSFFGPRVREIDQYAVE